ncbi:hypothetical protein [Bacillus rhizoplanae]|uniref:hypothetical protein n=1 Tax=Bacillus rhizoplanae TaxID=2880966 RepID=UPI003D1EA20E
MSSWKWEIHYAAEVQGVFSEEPIEIKVEKKSIDLKIRFINVAGFTKDKVQFECLDYKSNNRETALKNTRELVTNIINILADKFGASFTQFLMVHIKEFEQKGCTKMGVVRVEKVDNVQLTKTDVNDLVTSLIDDTYVNFLSTNPQQKIYRSIIFSQNKVGKFIAMYSLLSEIIENHGTEAGNGQGKVDKFIRSQANYWNASEERDSTKHKDRHGNPIKETKYTWLRNQIGHTQLNTDILQVENEIESSYPTLVKLVQIAIRTYLR